ncbi:MAG: DUF5053 domain-containing protein [Capnocytophaga felis]|nr:DUF5053 domain-containing protein [Capnocytophaga felis]
MKLIEKELEKLMQLSGTPDFDTELDRLKTIYTSDEDRKQIKAFVLNGLNNVEKEIKTLDVKLQLAEISEFINMSYIAKHYFNRSKQWLSQRLNGNIVGGKPRYLSESEKQTLNNALKDLSQRINAVEVF